MSKSYCLYCGSTDFVSYYSEECPGQIETACKYCGKIITIELPGFNRDMNDSVEKDLKEQHK